MKRRNRKAFILALTVFFMSFVSCATKPNSVTITREQLLLEPVDNRDTLSKLLGTPADPREDISGRFAVLRKECSFSYSQEPIYTLEMGELFIPFCTLMRSLKFPPGFPSDWSFLARKGWKPKPLDFKELQQFRCSKEEFESVEVGELVRIEGAMHREFGIGVIRELKKSYGPMIYDPDGLIYYLYHKPAE